MHTTHTQAIAFAKLVNASEAISKEIKASVESAERNKQSVHRLYIRLLTAENIGKGKLDATPVPGTDEGNNPDNYEDVDANGKKINSSFSRDFADNLDEGQTIVSAMRNISATADMSQPDKEAALKRWNARLTTLRSLVRRALLVHHRVAEIENKFPHVAVTLKTVTKDGTDTYDMNTVTPIVLMDNRADQDPKKPRAYKYVSVGEFLAFKLERAEINKASVGEWSALVKSSKAGKKKGGKGGTVAGAQVPRITSVDLFEQYASETAAFLDDGSGTEKGVAQVMAKLAKMPKGDDRKHYVLTLYRNALAWDMIFRAVANEGETYALEQSAINAGNKKAAA